MNALQHREQVRCFCVEADTPCCITDLKIPLSTDEPVSLWSSQSEYRKTSTARLWEFQLLCPCHQHASLLHVVTGLAGGELCNCQETTACSKTDPLSAMATHNRSEEELHWLIIAGMKGALTLPTERLAAFSAAHYAGGRRSRRGAGARGSGARLGGQAASRDTRGAGRGSESGGRHRNVASTRYRELSDADHRLLLLEEKENDGFIFADTLSIMPRSQVWTRTRAPATPNTGTKGEMETD
ncbi:uncharacterized protein LOC128943104 [Melozone crissalis]|uniref:uncharacterized protein LOC128943104 n=1 Tax=Melozone crissalis TaxID=40204 RepID=UPI0023DC7BDF|nr:uncharacterized protein LOC128943104 [Melozone crissalis]